jgi:hypothetical protein
MFIINIEPSPLRNRLYRIFLIDGSTCDIGNKYRDYYLCHCDKKKRNRELGLLNEKEINMIKTLEPSQLLYETFILNGYSRDIIKNINFYNKEILKYLYDLN